MHGSSTGITGSAHMSNSIMHGWCSVIGSSKDAHPSLQMWRHLKQPTVKLGMPMAIGHCIIQHDLHEMHGMTTAGASVAADKVTALQQ